MGKWTKQKLKTKSSTEAELIGASNYLPSTIWLKLFMEAQGHKMDEIVFDQEVESAIWMETNRWMSAGQKSRHINIRYFWIKDQTKALEIDVRHCPILSILADFFTKPLNGSLFWKFRDVILRYERVSSSLLPFIWSSIHPFISNVIWYGCQPDLHYNTQVE